MRIGTRASKLALIQAAEVKSLLLTKTSLTEDQIEIVTITTSGDRIQDRNLAEIGGKGLFIKELEEFLLANKIDIAIHSAKDVPPMLHEDTRIAAFTTRKDPRDYFISQKFNSIEELPQHAVVGTSSARRKAILLRLRPDLKIINFRGNVDTRLGKLADGEVDATILASCGLGRLQKEVVTQNIIPLETMLSAGGQGSLAIQIRENDLVSAELVRKINDEESEICVATERAFLRELGASCKTPVSVYCKLEGGILNLRTIIFDFDGGEIFATENSDDAANGERLALKAAHETKMKAGALLAKICAN
jgi:hydroxymethylbilane synthase